MNKAAAATLAQHLASGLQHPGNPDTGQPPKNIPLPGLSTTGIPPEMAAHFANEAGLPDTVEPTTLLAEAIIACIETEFTITTHAELAALQQAAADAPDGTQIRELRCTDHHVALAEITAPKDGAINISCQTLAAALDAHQGT